MARALQKTGPYGPVAERIKVHCFFVKTVGTVPVFVGQVPFLLCRVNAPTLFLHKNDRNRSTFYGPVPFFLCRVNAPSETRFPVFLEPTQMLFESK